MFDYKGKLFYKYIFSTKKFALIRYEYNNKQYSSLQIFDSGEWWNIKEVKTGAEPILMLELITYNAGAELLEWQNLKRSKRNEN